MLGTASSRDYDTVHYDEFFAHTFKDLGATPGHTICGASMTLQVKCQHDNDTISVRFVDELGVQDPDAIWGQFLVDTPLNVPADGSATTVTLDLANLPPVAGYPTNLLPALNAHGFADIILQDDTGVDFVTLDLTYCCE